MAAVVASSTGGPSVLEYKSSHPTPKPTAGQVLVKNTFAGVNYIDTYFRTGLYPSPTGLPMVIGQEASGTIAALGPDTTSDLKEGDRVVWMKFGGYAEYSAVPIEKVVKIPDGIKDEDAIGSFLMGMTAMANAQEAYPVKKGDFVLVHAAAGGVGLLMCQILKKIGARTIGTAGGPEKCALAKENGAEFMIDYKADSDWLSKVKEITNGEGVHAVYDGVGKDTWEHSLEAVRRKGTVVFFGNASGPVPAIPLPKLTAKNSKVLRPTLVNYTATREELEYYANEVFQMVKSGEMKVKVHKAYPLKDAKLAHEDLEGRRTTGKLLLKL